MQFVLKATSNCHVDGRPRIAITGDRLVEDVSVENQLKLVTGRADIERFTLLYIISSIKVLRSAFMISGIKLGV